MNTNRLFTNLTIFFATVAIVEFIVGLYAERYMVNYKGSFFANELPNIFLITILLSIVSNIVMVIINYIKNENT